MKKWGMLFLCLFVLVGCVQKKIIDEIDIIAGEAYDIDGNKKFIGSILIQNYLPDKSIENKVFVTKGMLRRDLLLNAQKQASGNIVTGGIEITIFGDKLANQGVIDFIDTYERDASIGARGYLATANKTALEILKGNYGPQGVSRYLSSLLEHNIAERDIPNTNLHLFVRDFYMKGKDPYLPELKQKNKDEVEVSGLSIFKGDKEIDVVPKEKMFFFKLLVDKHSKGNFRVSLKNGEDAAVRSIQSTYKYKITRKNEQSHADVRLKIQGEIREYTGKKMNNHHLHIIAKQLENSIEKECTKLIKHFQELNTDPIGFGHMHIKRIRGYDFNRWKSDYANMTFNVKADVMITETGVVD